MLSVLGDGLNLAEDRAVVLHLSADLPGYGDARTILMAGTRRTRNESATVDHRSIGMKIIPSQRIRWSIALELKPMDPGWAAILAGVAGGLVATIAALLSAWLAWRLNNKARRNELRVDALADWAQAFNALTSHHENFYRLVQLAPSASVAPTGQKEAYDNDVVRVAAACGDAGREVDATRYRVLLVETDAAIRDEVERLTRETIAPEFSSLSHADRASAYLRRVPNWRKALDRLLRDAIERNVFNP